MPRTPSSSGSSRATTRSSASTCTGRSPRRSARCSRCPPSCRRRSAARSRSDARRAMHVRRMRRSRRSRAPSARAADCLPSIVDAARARATPRRDHERDQLGRRLLPCPGAASLMAAVTAQRLLERSLRIWGPRTAVSTASGVDLRELGDRSARLANSLSRRVPVPRGPLRCCSRTGASSSRPTPPARGPGSPGWGSATGSARRSAATSLATPAPVLVASPALSSRSARLPGCVRIVLVVADDAPTRSRERGDTYEAALGRATAAVNLPVASRRPELHPLHERHHRPPKGATHSQGGRAASPRHARRRAAPGTRTGDGPRRAADPRQRLEGARVPDRRGGCNVVLGRFSPGLRRCRSDRGSDAHVPGADDDAAARRRPRGRVAAASSRPEQISFGGAPISAGAFRAAIQQFGPILTQVYGSSEAPAPDHAPAAVPTTATASTPSDASWPAPAAPRDGSSSPVDGSEGGSGRRPGS